MNPFLALPLLTALQLQDARIDREDPFIDLPGGKQTVALAPGESASEGRTVAMTWSPQGDGLLIQRVDESRPAAWVRSLGVKPLEPEGASVSSQSGEVLVWDRKTGRKTTLWRYDPEKSDLVLARWMANGRFVCLSAASKEAPGRPRRQLVMLFPASGGKPVIVYDSAATGIEVVWTTSLTEPFGVVGHATEGGDGRLIALRPFGPSGFLGPETSLHFPGERLSSFGLAIAEDGKHAVVMAATDRSGTLIPWIPERGGFLRGMTDVKTQWQSALRAGDASVSLAPVTLGRGETSDRTGTWLSVGRDLPKLLVTSDGEAPVLAPDGKAVAYRHNGMTLVRQVLTFDRLSVETVRRSLAERRAMETCRIAADAIGSLLGHEKFPTVAAFNEAVARAYPGARGFVYAPGSSADFREGVTRYLLGSASVYGGKAVLFGDLHWEWVPDKPVSPPNG